ncbi:MAG: Brp/Blh family beta-carotene 15,15'-dioxygenase, partial [Planctomycetota bacterium]
GSRRARHARWAASLTAVALAAGALLPTPGLAAQVVVTCLAVALLGFPHGALDPLVAAQRSDAGASGRGGTAAFLAAYLAAAGAVVALWLVSPPAGLALFLATSAVHFGLGDVPPASDPREDRARPLRVLVHGSAPIVLPSALHPAGVGLVFGWLLGAPAESVTSWIGSIGPAFVAAWILAAVAAYGPALLRGRAADPQARRGALELGLLAATFAGLPPLLSFTVYFCAWHSARHLIAVDTALGRDLRARALVVGLAVLAATALLVLAAYVVDPGAATAAAADQGPGAAMVSAIRTLFIALAALTPPHMVVTAVLERRLAARESRAPRLA